MTSLESGGPSLQDRERLEAFHTYRRAVELEFDPVRGNFDAAHLKEINRRIFQDLPGLGFDDVRPGEFRSPVPEGKDWIKNRGLSTVRGSFHVAYSAMDKAAEARLGRVLEGAKPEKLRELKTAEFTAAMGKLYAELDYVHPFGDGNSRTLRTFTRQLARESGYELDWTRFNASDTGRDLLYIARDRSVNALARPHIQHEATMRKIINSVDRLERNRDLPDLLRDAVRPNRAIAFERRSETEALEGHPELAGAYAILKAVAKKAEADGLDVQQRELVVVRARTQVAALIERGDVPTIELHAIRPAKAVSFEVDKPEDALRKHPELRSAFLTVKAAEAYAATLPVEARQSFIDQTRARVRETLDEGKDMPMPSVRERDAGRDR